MKTCPQCGAIHKDSAEGICGICRESLKSKRPIPTYSKTEKAIALIMIITFVISGVAAYNNTQQPLRLISGMIAILSFSEIFFIVIYRDHVIECEFNKTTVSYDNTTIGLFKLMSILITMIVMSIIYIISLILHEVINYIINLIKDFLPIGLCMLLCIIIFKTLVIANKYMINHIYNSPKK